MGKSQLFDLEHHFSSYKAYHTHPINKYIHIFSVYPVLFTFLVLSSSIYYYGSGLNFGFIFAMLYGLFLVSLDKKAGSLAALFCIASWLLASSLANTLHFSLLWKIVLGVQLLGSTLLVMGHGIFETRLTFDHYLQTVLVEPFCIYLEVLEVVFGYEPYPGFHASTQSKVQVEIENWQDKQQKKVT